MKIYTEDLKFLRDRLTTEGNIIVQSVEEADLVFCPWNREFNREGKECITSGFVVGREALGVEVEVSTHPADFAYIKWFQDGKFSDQTFLLLPLRGFMNGNLGQDVTVGCASRGIAHCNSDIFENQTVIQSLIASNHRGFVSVLMDGTAVCDITTGVPWNGFYCLCEYINGPLAEWFVNPLRLFECWSICNLISIEPFPRSDTREDPLIFDCPSVQTRRHLWLHQRSQAIRRSIVTSSSQLGVATAWGRSINEVVDRVLLTCKNLRVEGKQYRTDLQTSYREQYKSYLDRTALSCHS